MHLITSILASSILLISFAGELESFALHKFTDASVLSLNVAKGWQHFETQKSSIAPTNRPEQVLVDERGSGRDKEDTLVEEQV